VPLRAAAWGVGIGAVLVVAGCAGPEAVEDEEAVFDRAEYCEAMHTSAPSIDTDAMGGGDAEALETAGQTYEHLALLAPEELAYEWRVIISDMQRMILEARGEDAVTDEDAAEFRSAYQTVYSDYIDNCVETPGPTAE
jgi:hypothetical protein